MAKKTKTKRIGRSPTARVTIKDVAAAAGVSPMTVSNVLNGKKHEVGKRTQSLVEETIARLGYRVQSTGRSLRVSRRQSVGMIIVDTSPSYLADPFTANIVAGLSNVLSSNDYTLTVQGLRPSQFERAFIIRNFVVDGFCVLLSGTSRERSAITKTLRKLEQPVILIQEATATPDGDLCVIRQDDVGGGRMIANHLLARRAKRFLIVVPKLDWSPMEQRVRGLRQTIKSLEPDAEITLLRSPDEEFDHVQAMLATHFSKHPLPDAIVGGNDRIGIAAMSLLLERGVEIPGKVMVTGFNGFEFCKYAQPTLTTVVSPAYSIGERAGELMLARLKGQPFSTREIVFPVHFAEGKST